MPDGAGTPVTLGRADLERLLPHREPALLVDNIDAVDLDSLSVRGSRYLARTDPAFIGHFRAQPVYPGVLVLEAIGQLALTLLYFADAWRLDVPEDTTPPRVSDVHIHRATFIAPFHPGDTIALHARMLASDETVVAVGQAWKDGMLAAFTVSELYVDQEMSREHWFEQRAAGRRSKQPPRRAHGGPLGHLALEGFLD